MIARPPSFSSFTASDDELKLAFAAARAMARKRAGELYFAMYFLPARKRNAVAAAIAFCGMIYEAIDLPHDAARGATGLRAHPAAVSPRSLRVLQEREPESSCALDTLENRIAMLRDRLDEIYKGELEFPAVASRSQPQHALCAFMHAARRFQIPREYFIELAEAIRQGRANTAIEPQSWCRDVGGKIALIVASVLGMTNSAAFAHAMALGEAVHLTMLDRDRIPFDRARELFDEGLRALPWLADDGSRLAAAAVATVQLAKLDQMQHDRSSKLSAAQKVRAIAKAWRLARRAAAGEPPRRIH